MIEPWNGRIFRLPNARLAEVVGKITAIDNIEILDKIDTYIDDTVCKLDIMESLKQSYIKVALNNWKIMDECGNRHDFNANHDKYYIWHRKVDPKKTGCLYKRSAKNTHC